MLITSDPDNPTDIVAGNQHWGHTTSRDLYTWENQPIAIYPGAEGEGIFTGSSVIDVNNTSGFFPNQTNGVVAFYTLHTSEEETQDVRPDTSTRPRDALAENGTTDSVFHRWRLHFHQICQQSRHFN